MTKHNKISIFNILMIFPVIYSIELILGFSGGLIILAGQPIRIFTFTFAFVSLYIGFFIKYYGDGNTVSTTLQNFKVNFTFLDISVFFFLVFNFIWATLIPYINNGSVTMAISEIDGMTTMAMFFPASYLIRKKHINWDLYKSFILVLVVIFASLHIVFYVLDKRDIGFIENFFSFLINLLGGNGDIPKVIRGHGYTRVIFPSTILIFIGIYICLQKTRTSISRYILIYIFLVLSILATITKSLMLGGLIGGIFIVVYYIVFIKDITISKLVLTFIVVTLVTVIASDVLLFDNLITQRMSNLYISDENNISIGNGLTEIEKNELEGSIEGNQIRIQQTRDLLQKFSEQPITGFGYGSYLKHNIRGHEGYYYLYEVFIPAMLMKIGIIGFIVWILFGLAILYYLYKNVKWNNTKIPLILFGFCSMCVIIQTNPLLLGFSGMFIITFLLLDIEDIILDTSYFRIAPLKRYSIH